MTVHTEIIHGEEVFDRLAGEWDGLVDQSMTSTPFQRLAYQQAWWRHLGPGTLHTVAVRDGSDQLRALACLYVVDGTVYFNGCVEETDYLDLIAAADDAAEAWSAVFERLESEDFPAWTRLNLCNIPERSPSRSILSRLAGERGYAFTGELQDVCPVIALPQSFDDYLMALDGKQRREIRRKLRRAAAAGAEVVRVGPDDDVAAAVETFLNLLQLSLPEKDDWLNEGRRAVFHEVAAVAQRDGLLQLLFLEVRGEKAAALFNFDYKDRIWVYNSGFDFAQFGWLSPGVVLTAEAIAAAIDDGRRLFDFLRGDEVYKYRFGAEDTQIYRITVQKE